MANYIAKGRQVVIPLTNKAANAVEYGDVVILDTTATESFDVTTTPSYSGSWIGVVVDNDGIAVDAIGRVCVSGYVPQVNLDGAAAIGDYLFTDTVAEQGTPNAARGEGAFGQALEAGAAPSAYIWGNPDGAGGAAGDVATDDIWDAKGDLAVGTGANTASRLAVGADGLIVAADSAETTGLGYRYLPGLNTIINDDPLTIRGCFGWYDAGKITGLNDGDTVVAWNDASGYGHDMIMAGTRPTYQTNEINSLPIVRFGGSGSGRMLFPSCLQTWALVVVFKMASIVPAYSSILGFSPFADRGGFFVKSNGKTAFYNYSTTSWDGTGAATIGTVAYNYYILNVHYATADGRKDGAADVTGGSSAMQNMGTDIGLFADHTSAGRTASMDVAEVISYKNELSAANITTLESYITTKYSL